MSPRKHCPPVYTKLITTRTSNIETILKLVQAPDEQGMLLERFCIMWPDGKASDLQLVMQLKGISKTMQTSILESSHFGLTANDAIKLQNSLEEVRSGKSSTTGSGSSISSSSVAAANMMRKYGSDTLSSIKKLGQLS